MRPAQVGRRLPARLATLFCLALSISTAAAAERVDYELNETPAAPTPSWVEPVDLGQQDPALAGIVAPRGLRVEIVAQEPVVVNPVGMTFADDGTPYVLEWRVAPTAAHVSYEVTFRDGTKARVNRMQKDTRDELKLLRDADGDGRYEAASVLLNDLEIPSSILLNDGWVYLSSLGQITRRRPSLPGGAFDETQLLVQGLCGFHHHQASGMTLSHDGWLFITSGDDDNHGEGRDGSRATVLRTGAIFRCRPDGSQLTEFARGFRNPYRNVAYDHLYNMFHVDNDQEDGSKFQGCRLMHVQEAADYGWRLAAGTVCCRTDFDRGAVFGEMPGKMPSLLKTGRGSPAGLLIYQGTRFPDQFRGLLIYPDVYRKLVRAYRVERRGTTFAVTEQFELLRSEDGQFRPCQAVMGPDGAIYIADWRTDSGGAGRLWGDGHSGRIYRLTWGGSTLAPAIPRGAMDEWAKIPAHTDDELFNLLETADFEVRARVVRELVRRGAGHRARLVELALDSSAGLPARVAALGAACQLDDPSVEAAMVLLLDDPQFELRRLAADALSRNAQAGRVRGQLVAALAHHLDDPHPAARRAIALAAGQLASLLPDGADERRTTAGALLAALRPVSAADDPYLFDGILRGIERLGRDGVEVLVALVRSASPEDRELGVSAMECLRTTPAAAGLDALVSNPPAVTDAQFARLLTAYRQILVEPAIDASAVGRWLESHPDASAELQLVALSTLAKVGGTDPARTLPFVLNLLKHPHGQMRLAVIDVVGENHLVAAAGELVKLLRDAHRELAERQAIVRVLGTLRQQDLPFGDKTAKGVELVVDDLASIVADAGAGPIRTDVLAVLASVDFDKARPLAQAMLTEEDLAMVRAAIDALGARRELALEIGRMFADGKLPRDVLPQVVSVLQKHVEKDESGDVAALLKDVLRGGLLVALDSEAVARVEALVKETGDPEAGRGVYLDTQRSQCAKCHKLEGHGGQVGPDLSKVWETHTVAKLLESMIDPSKEVKEGYQTFTVTTTAGQVYQGLRIENTEARVVLRDNEGKDITIPTGEIEEMAASDKSLMPEGVVAQLSFQQFVDLVAFLKSRESQEKLRELSSQGGN